VDFVGNLSLFVAMKKFTNRLRINKAISMVRLAQFFFDSQCIVRIMVNVGIGVTWWSVFVGNSFVWISIYEYAYSSAFTHLVISMAWNLPLWLYSPVKMSS